MMLMLQPAADADNDDKLFKMSIPVGEQGSEKIKQSKKEGELTVV